MREDRERWRANEIVRNLPRRFARSLGPDFGIAHQGLHTDNHRNRLDCVDVLVPGGAASAEHSNAKFGGVGAACCKHDIEHLVEGFVSAFWRFQMDAQVSNTLRLEG